MTDARLIPFAAHRHEKRADQAARAAVVEHFDDLSGALRATGLDYLSASLDTTGHAVVRFNTDQLEALIARLEA